MNLDRRDIIQHQSRQQYGTHHSYRDDSVLTRFQTSLNRTERARRRHIERSESRASERSGPNDFGEIPGAIITSSGTVRSRGSRRSTSRYVSSSELA